MMFNANIIALLRIRLCFELFFDYKSGCLRILPVNWGVYSDSLIRKDGISPVFSLFSSLIVTIIVVSWDTQEIKFVTSIVNPDSYDG